MNASVQHPIIIALWSGPRNVSTALMYSFAQRRDTKVLDEPLFGHFLKHTGVWRPSREEALATMESRAEVLLTQFSQPADRSFLFLKNMANHLEGLPMDISLNYRNVILTRHPAKVLSSYVQQVENPTELDLCYRHQLELLDYLVQNQQTFFVMDSDQLLQNPESMLRDMCSGLKVPFDQAMLSWPAEPRPEDGIWAKYWYANVHKSTGFHKPDTHKEYTVPGHLQELLSSSLEYYQKIKEYEQIQPTRFAE